MHFYRFATVDQRQEATRDFQELAFQRHVIRQFEQQFGKLLFALGLDRRGEQGLLVGEMAVHRELGNPSLGGDGVHAAAVVTITQEQALGRLEDGTTFGGILWSAGAGRL